MNEEILHNAGDDAAEQPLVSESNAELETLRQQNEELKKEIRLGKARATLTAELTASGARSPGSQGRRGSPCIASAVVGGPR